MQDCIVKGECVTGGERRSIADEWLSFWCMAACNGGGGSWSLTEWLEEGEGWWSPPEAVTRVVNGRSLKKAKGGG